MRGRILLVDDDDASLVTMAALLEDAGFHVVTAASRAEAEAELASSGVLHAVLCDYNLDDGAGTDLLPLVRGANPATRFAILSGDPPAGGAAVDAWLSKGDAPEALIAAAERLVDDALKPPADER